MSEAYCDYVIDLLQGWHLVVARRMFGGYGLYRAGQIFAIIIDEVLYFKADDSNRADYEAVESVPFMYEAKGKPVALAYWQVPAEMFDDADMLGAWAEKAYQAGLRSKQKPKKRTIRK